MTRITLDRSMLKALHDLSEPLELCDESGRLLGTFTPAASGSSGETVERTERQHSGQESGLGEPLGHLAYSEDLE